MDLEKGKGKGNDGIDRFDSSGTKRPDPREMEKEMSSPKPQPAPVSPAQVVISPEAIEALFRIRKNELDKQEDRIKNLLSTADAKRSELSDAFRKTIQADLKEYREEQEHKVFKKWWWRFAFQLLYAFIVAFIAVFLFNIFYERTEVYRLHKDIAERWFSMDKEKEADENAAKPEDASVKKPAEKKK